MKPMITVAGVELPYEEGRRTLSIATSPRSRLFSVFNRADPGLLFVCLTVTVARGDLGLYDPPAQRLRTDPS